MSDFIKHTDEELLKEICLDNLLAFDTLYNRYSKRVYRFACSILKTKEDAENIVQDVFLIFWDNRDKIEKGSSIKNYIFTVTHNSIISLFRRKTKEANYIEYLRSLQETEQDPEETGLEYDELQKKLVEIIDQLPDRQKEVLLLSKIEGLTYKDIAERLKISTNTIENHMSRALRNLRRKLAHS